MSLALVRAFKPAVQNVRLVSGYCSRSVSVRAMTTATVLSYSEPGDPVKVLNQTKAELNAPAEDEVLLQMLASPINPSDLLTVQGLYPLQPTHGIPGHDGVAKVLEVGGNVTNVKPGDCVIPLASALGTWRTHGLFQAADWLPVPDALPLEAAAALTINPGTALGMLENFVELQSGDVVVQDGGNSSVGELVIQMAHAKGVKTVSIVRDRENWDAVAGHLKELGADHVVRPDDLRAVFKDQGVPAPKLALDCVGGDIQLNMLKTLAKGGTMVTYGGMSLKPVTVPMSLLIFKDIRVRGFWISGGKLKGDRDAKAALFKRVADLMIEAGIKYECTPVNFETEWKQTIEAIGTGGSKKTKYLLKMSD